MAQKDIQLPDIGEGVTEGELVQWLVKPGDSISMDQPLAEVMTDKATVEIPSSVTGKVIDLKVGEGDVVAVGAPIMSYEEGASTESSKSSESKKENKKTESSSPKPAPASSPSEPSAGLSAMTSGDRISPPVADSKVLATPSTRRLARELNVDINQIQGSGNAGRVTREDVRGQSSTGAVAAGQPTFDFPKLQRGNESEEVREPMKGIRRKVAEKMQLSKHIVPHFTLMDEADVTELVSLRGEMKEKAKEKGVKVTYLPFVMKALIATCREFPMMNASIDDEAQEIVYKNIFNIGFAADTPNGLMVPVIHNADQKSILQISKEIVELSEQARTGKIALESLKNATISITNIGSVGGAYATPIINHPEVAILGMYKIQKKPVFLGDEIVAAHTMNLSITADHRLIDGAVAARFLKAFIERLQNPSVLMLDLI